MLGRAVAWRLVRAGWSVEVTGRDAAKMPGDLLAAGVRFVPSDRRNSQALAAVIGAGADLLVDALCFTAADAKQLLPHLPDIASTVMFSSKAVYVDGAGNHVNSEVPPRFSEPIEESAATLAPSNTLAYDSPEGYGANKVAAELELLDSGSPVSVVRASKVHGAAAANPREWVYLKRVLDQRPVIFLAEAGLGGDHTTAAVNAAALVETVAAVPGRRILNSADPDALNGREISRIICHYLGHSWEEILLDHSAPTGLGAHPWDYSPQIVLSTQESLKLGYVPVGSYAQTIPLELDWLLARPANQPELDNQLFAGYFEYALEDRFLAAKT